MLYDWLIVGAGYTGSILAERIASQLEQTVLLIDRREHIGGNAYDYYDEHGILVHKYGAHLFHTNSEDVFRYLSSFTSWDAYQHEVRAYVNGVCIPVPFNLNSLHALFPGDYAKRLANKLISKYGLNTNIPILKLLKEENDPEIKSLADFIFENVFYNYTVKQWGLLPEQLSAGVLSRVPVCIGHDNRYFRDIYQVLPSQGYTAMFHRMLDNPRIEVALNNDYRKISSDIEFRRLIYTGPVDEYFDFIYGKLPYRSLRFDHQHYDCDDFQHHAVINYPNDHAYTRILEFKHMSRQPISGTSIVYEYPQAHVHGITEPYYPIPREENACIYERYASEIRKLRGKVYFAGRLADYRYYNMDQAASRALSLFKNQILQVRAGLAVQSDSF